MDVVRRIERPLPFIRAYSPELAPLGVEEKDFLAFIDNLALVQAGPVAFQAVNAVGAGMSSVPHHWAVAIGTGIQVVIGAGTAAIIIARTKKYLASANEEYFNPRGLKVSLKKDPEVAALLGVSPDQKPLAPITMDSNELFTLRDRRMHVFSPYIASLTTDVAPPAKQRNFLDRISAKQISWTMKRKERRLNRQHKKALRKQHYPVDPQASSSHHPSRDQGAGVYEETDSFRNSDSDSDSDENAIPNNGEKSGHTEWEQDDILYKEASTVEHREPNIFDRREEVAERRVRRTDNRSQRKALERDDRLERKVVKLQYLVVENL